MVQQPPLDFKSLHKRAAELCEEETIFAYAVAKELRKRVVGRKSESLKQDLMQRLIYTAYNSLIELEPHKDNPKYLAMILDLAADTIIMGHDILTERIGHAENN